MSTAIHWFRRDLRVADNQALHAASRDHARVYGLYLFEERALRAPSAGAPRLAFALDCLQALEKNLRERGGQLLWRRGDAVEEIVRAVRETGAQALYYNFDGEPAGFARDRKVRAALEAEGIVVRAWKDDVLHDAREVLKADGKPYVVFTPYAAAWRALPKEKPVAAFRLKAPVPTLPTMPLPTLAELGFSLEAAIPKGGEHAGQAVLKEFLSGPIAQYRSRRDFPAVEGTSRLSPHLTAGTLSPRTFYARAAEAIVRLKAGEEGETFQKELIWREFYRQILWKFPQVETGAFRPALNAIAWENDQAHFAAWCAGKTGFPLVDAAMRQLNATGWMHNRLRMVTATFLCKDLLVNWQWGELYFMQRLADGDLASNNGGWQWSAGTGTDAQPYFRIFNPLRQAERYDPEGAFIARWVPEAESPGYRPMIDHSAQRLKALALYKRAVG